MPTDVENWKSEAYGREVRDRLFEFAEEGVRLDPGRRAGRVVRAVQMVGPVPPAERTGGVLYDADRDPERRARTGTAPNYRRDRRRVRSRSRTNPIFGDAYADFTTRQSIQLTGSNSRTCRRSSRSSPRTASTTQQACGDSWRNIVGNPVAGKDGQEVVEAWPVIRDLNQTFKGNDDHANLPGSGKCP